MPTLPWTAAEKIQTDLETTAIVMASRLELRSLHDVPGFLRASFAIRRQTLRTPGALGVSLIAQPISKTFWTLSAWRDQASLNTFTAGQPHKAIMPRFRPRMRESTFVFWSVDASELPVSWADAHTRIAAQRASAPQINT